MHSLAVHVLLLTIYSRCFVMVTESSAVAFMLLQKVICAVCVVSSLDTVMRRKAVVMSRLADHSGNSLRSPQLSSPSVQPPAPFTRDTGAVVFAYYVETTVPLYT